MTKSSELRTKFLGARDLVVEAVQLDSLDEPVYIRVMSAGAREKFEAYAASHAAGEPIPEFRQTLLVKTLCDKEGQLLLADDEAHLLSDKSSESISKLFDVAMRLNRLRKEDVDQAEKS